MIPEIYRWDDDSAPQMTNCSSWDNFKSMFQAIFVDGYGTKQASTNWTYTFDDATENIRLTSLNGHAFGAEHAVNTAFTPRVRAYDKDGNKFTYLDSVFPLFGGNNDDLKICPWIVMVSDNNLVFLRSFNNTVDAPNIPTDWGTVPQDIQCLIYGKYKPRKYYEDKNFFMNGYGGTITVKDSTPDNSANKIDNLVNGPCLYISHDKYGNKLYKVPSSNVTETTLGSVRNILRKDDNTMDYVNLLVFITSYREVSGSIPFILKPFDRYPVQDTENLTQALNTITDNATSKVYYVISGYSAEFLIDVNIDWDDLT